jgi:hypothetical protein
MCASATAAEPWRSRKYSSFWIRGPCLQFLARLRCMADVAVQALADRRRLTAGAGRGRSRGVGCQARGLPVEIMFRAAPDGRCALQKPWRSPSRPGERLPSPSATASGAPDRLLCPFPVRHMSVISRPAEHVTGNCDGPWRRLERVVDAGPAGTPRSSVRYKRMQHRSVRTAGRQAKPGRAHGRPC